MTVFTIEKLGRKKIQFMGFAMMTVLLVIASAAWTPLRSKVNCWTLSADRFQPRPSLALRPLFCGVLCPSMGHCQSAHRLLLDPASLPPSQAIWAFIII